MLRGGRDALCSCGGQEDGVVTFPAVPGQSEGSWHRPCPLAPPVPKSFWGLWGPTKIRSQWGCPWGLQRGPPQSL